MVYKIDWSDKATLKRNQNAVTDLHAKLSASLRRLDVKHQKIQELVDYLYEDIKWLNTQQHSGFCRGKVIGLKQAIWYLKGLLK